MKATVHELADLVHGTVVGDGAVVIGAARPLQDAQLGDITFLEDVKRGSLLQQSPASAFIVPPQIAFNSKPLIHASDPLMAFIAVFQHFQDKPAPYASGIDPRAAVHASAHIDATSSVLPLVGIGENTTVGKRCVLHGGVIVGRNCRLGDDVILYSNVVLYDNTVVGDRVIIHANAVVGGDGFGYRTRQGRHVKVPQMGNVVIEADVEIGAGTTIDRSTFQSTRIGAGTKIDNLVQIAHNCQIGKHNLLAAQVGIAGSTSTGAYVVLGGQVGVRDHIHLGDGVMVGAQSGVQHDTPPGTKLFGSPAQDDRDAARMLAAMKKLPTMRKDLLRILRQLGLDEGGAGSQAA